MATAKVADVNREFAARRAAQMENAKRDADGNWIASSGWDANEVIGKDGLATAQNGEAMLYSANPEPDWHLLGQRIPGGTTDVEKVLEASHLDFEVELVAAKYFNHVTKKIENVAEFTDPSTGEVLPLIRIPRRSDTGEAFAVSHGKQYTTMQNRDAFGFLQNVCQTGELLWESAGAFGNGERVFVCARLPENVIVDRGGIADEIVPIISAINSHDGKTKFVVITSPWRIVCANTERMAFRDAAYMWSVKHTPNMNSEAKRMEAQRTLGLTVKYYERFEEMATTMARAKMTRASLDKFLEELFPIAGEETPTKKNKNDVKKEEVRFLIETGERNENCRGTKWAAYNGVTEYLDHFRPLRPRGDMKNNPDAWRAQLNLAGDADDVKIRARELLVRESRSR